jgi:ubiquitin-protein ligase
MNNYIGRDLLNISNKRVQNELRVYVDKNYNKFIKNDRAHLISIESDNVNTMATFLFYVTDDKFTIVKFIFNKNRCYPFCPPDVRLFDTNYHGGLAKLNTNIMKFEETICLCCKSLLCKNNWYPGKKLNDIFEEIEINIKIKLRILDKKRCKYVVNKKFGHYVPIEEFL